MNLTEQHMHVLVAPSLTQSAESEGTRTNELFPAGLGDMSAVRGSDGSSEMQTTSLTVGDMGSIA